MRECICIYDPDPHSDKIIPSIDIIANMAATSTKVLTILPHGARSAYLNQNKVWGHGVLQQGQTGIEGRENGRGRLLENLILHLFEMKLSRSQEASKVQTP